MTVYMCMASLNLATGHRLSMMNLAASYRQDTEKAAYAVFTKEFHAYLFNKRPPYSDRVVRVYCQPQSILGMFYARLLEALACNQLHANKLAGLVALKHLYLWLSN